MKGGRIVNYRYRWIVECVFSSMKRIFGDRVSARKFPNMTKEMMIKASLYDMFIGMM
ncbi:MAG: transposase [Candidatus Nitrosopolaris sp.]